MRIALPDLPELPVRLRAKTAPAQMTQSPSQVLIVQSHAAVRITNGLMRAGYEVRSTGPCDAVEFLRRAAGCEVIIVNLGASRLYGLSLVKEWRRAGLSAPVLAIVGHDASHGGPLDARGLDVDVHQLTVPFEIVDLLAQVEHICQPAVPRAVLCGEALALDASRIAIAGRIKVQLTEFEYRVMSCLLERRGRAVSQLELNRYVYSGRLASGSNTIEVLVGRLRRKLGDSTIETVRGKGYRAAT